MNRHAVTKALEAFLRTENPSNRAPLDSHTDLLDAWFVDSLSVLNMVVFLEEHFAIRVARADINAQTFRSLEALTDYVMTRMDGRGR